MSDVLAEIRYVAVKSVCSLCVSSVSISFSHVSAYVEVFVVAFICCSFVSYFIRVVPSQATFLKEKLWVILLLTIHDTRLHLIQWYDGVIVRESDSHGIVYTFNCKPFCCHVAWHVMCNPIQSITLFQALWPIADRQTDTHKELHNKTLTHAHTQYKHTEHKNIRQ